MQIREIMEKRVVTIRPGDTASAAWTRMRRRDIRHLVVTDGASIVGVLSERDLGGRTGRSLRRSRVVRDLMAARVVTAEPDMTLADAADLMRSRLIGALPVVEDDELVGIVTATDVFEALGQENTGPLSWAERQLLRTPTSSKSLGGRTVPRSRSNAAVETRRTRRRPPKSPMPEPFAARVPRSVKRKAGRTPAALVPANIRVAGTSLDEDQRASIRRQLGRKLGKFADSIERVTVRVRDVNGPRGGVDKTCRIKVVLSGLPSVIVEEPAHTVERAFGVALEGTVRTVRRALEKRRTKQRKSAPVKRVAPARLP